MLQQRSWLGACSPTQLILAALRTQQPIDGGRTDPQQLLLRQAIAMQLVVSLQYGEQLWQGRLQTLAANVIHHSPDLDECRFHLLVVARRPMSLCAQANIHYQRLLPRLQPLTVLSQYSAGISATVFCQFDQLAQHQALLFFPAALISTRCLGHYRLPLLHRQPHSHLLVVPATGGKSRLFRVLFYLRQRYPFRILF